MKLDWKATGPTSDSGVHLMFSDPGSSPTGPDANGLLVPISPQSTGAVLPGKQADVAAAKPVGEWNTYEITVAWNTVTVVLNGTQVNRYPTTDPNRVRDNGFMGLRNSGTTDPVKFRNIRVKRNTAVRNGEVVGINNRCLDVPGFDPTVVQLQMWDCNNFPNQRWTFTADGRISNEGRCLGALNGGTASGTAVTFQACTTQNPQQWVVRPDGAIINVRSGKCLAPASADRSAALVIQDCTGAATQVWRIPDQHGQIGALTAPGNKCVDVYNNDPRNNRVVLFDCNAAALNQMWSSVGDGRLGSSGKCLDAAGTAAGSAVTLADCNANRSQQWELRGGAVVNVASSRCVTAASTTNLAAFTLQNCGAALQSWSLSAPTLWAGTLTSVGGKCADVKGENPANGDVWLWQCFGPPGESWEANGDGAVRSLGTCLDIGDVVNGTKTVVAGCHNGLSQQWSVRPDGTFVNVQSARCMDVQSAGTADGTKIQLWDCVGTAQQRWSVPLRAS